jgi:hypothetical protein
VTSAFRVNYGAVTTAVAIPSDLVIGIGAAAHANGDELPEIFFEGSWGSRGVLVSDGDAYEAIEGDETSWHHCPC